MGRNMHRFERPRARAEGLVVEQIDDELVIYDEVSRSAHALSPSATLVWERCDGRLSQSGIAEQLGLAPEMVSRAVSELLDAGLLEEPPSESGLSRREAAKKLAQIGGAAIVAPMVFSVSVASASGGLLSPCTCPAVVSSSNCCAQCSVIPCGTGPGQCNADTGKIVPGNQFYCCANDAGICGSGAATCYKLGGNCASEDICLCVQHPSCLVQGQPCTSDSQCCADCTGVTTGVCATTSTSGGQTICVC